MLRVGSDLEREEVAEIQSTRFLKAPKHIFGRSGEPEVDVLGGSGALDTQLDDEPALERYGLAEYGDDPREEAIEHEELTPASEIRPRARRRPKAQLESLLEGLGGRIGSDGHLGIPPNGLREALTSTSSSRAATPRWRACFVACRRSSGDSPSRAQSLRVLWTEVTGTGPNQLRSDFGTSA
jgi:hypothetical protein